MIHDASSARILGGLLRLQSEMGPFCLLSCTGHLSSTLPRSGVGMRTNKQNSDANHYRTECQRLLNVATTTLRWSSLPQTLFPMHPCFGVDRVVKLVSSELVVSGWEETAVALACCCKNFEDPALGVLWETQTNLLDPLLDTLPDEIWGPEDVCILMIFVSHPLNSSLLVTFQKIPNG